MNLTVIAFSQDSLMNNVQAHFIKLKDEAILQIATIVRGEDTHKFYLADQAAGLWAISAGLSVNFQNDYEQLVRVVIRFATFSIEI